jgi:hypothetical protein
MELPLYQKHLIDAMRLGNKVWMDNFNKITYHIKIKDSIKLINEPTIATLLWRGLIKMNGNSIVLTDLGCEISLVSNNNNKKTRYSIK